MRDEIYDMGTKDLETAGFKRRRDLDSEHYRIFELLHSDIHGVYLKYVKRKGEVSIVFRFLSNAKSKANEFLANKYRSCDEYNAIANYCVCRAANTFTKSELFELHTKATVMNFKLRDIVEDKDNKPLYSWKDIELHRKMLIAGYMHQFSSLSTDIKKRGTIFVQSMLSNYDWDRLIKNINNISAKIRQLWDEKWVVTYVGVHGEKDFMELQVEDEFYKCAVDILGSQLRDYKSVADRDNK